jgi:methionyl-tRNA formyltransferase
MAGSVVLIGTRSSLSVVGFRVLRELGISIPLIVAGDEDPGIDDWRMSLVKAARDAGYVDGENLLIVRDPHKSETLDRVRSIGPDLILSLQWRRILRPTLCELGKRGAVNLHNAPLPLLRGCDPFSWAVHDGLQVMGVTLHEVDEGVDTGRILTQRLWPISPSATAWQLYLESLTEAEILMRETLIEVIFGGVRAQDQLSRYASYHPLGQFSFGELEVNWAMPSTALSAWIRARVFPPFQIPFFDWRGQRVEILECRTAAGRGGPGTVLNLDPFLIASGRAALEIITIRSGNKELRGRRIAECMNVSLGESLRTS